MTKIQKNFHPSYQNFGKHSIQNYNPYNAPDEDEDLQMTEAPTFVRDSEKREESADEIPDFEPQDGTREEPDELNGDPDLILDEDRRARSQIKGKVGKNSKVKSSGYNAPDEDKDLQMTEAPTFVRDNEKREESADEIPALPSNGIHISESGDVLEELELPVVEDVFENIVEAIVEPGLPLEVPIDHNTGAIPKHRRKDAHNSDLNEEPPTKKQKKRSQIKGKVSNKTKTKSSKKCPIEKRTCDVCGKIFYDEANKYTHRDIFHPDPDIISMRYCDLCKMWFTGQHEWVKHKKRKKHQELMKQKRQEEERRD